MRLSIVQPEAKVTLRLVISYRRVFPLIKGDYYNCTLHRENESMGSRYQSLSIWMHILVGYQRKTELGTGYGVLRTEVLCKILVGHEKIDWVRSAKISRTHRKESVKF